MRYEYNTSQNKRELFVKNQSKIGANGIPTYLITPIIDCLCEQMNIIISKSSSTSVPRRLLKKVVDEDITTEAYHVIALGLQEKNAKGVELAKKAYISEYKSKYYMDCEQRFNIKYGNKMLEEGNRVIQSLLSIRKLFDKDIDFITFNLSKNNLYDDFKRLITEENKINQYISLIKSIVVEHVQTILQDLLAHTEGDESIKLKKFFQLS